MNAGMLAIAGVLIFLVFAEPLRALWSPLAPLSGGGVTGSPGGSHPLVTDGGLTWETPEQLTFASDGECWAQGVAGTESYVIELISKSDTLHYRRRDIAY